MTKVEMPLYDDGRGHYDYVPTTDDLQDLLNNNWRPHTGVHSGPLAYRYMFFPHNNDHGSEDK